MGSDSEGQLLSQGHGAGQAASSAIIQEPTDNAWALAFKLNVIITILTFVWALSTRPTAEREMQVTLQDAGYYIWGFAVLVLLTYCLSFCMLRAMTRWSKPILQIGFVGVVVPSVMIVAWLLVPDAVLWAMVPGFVFARATYALVGPARVSFAAANLKVAALAAMSIPQVLLWSLSMTVIRGLWLVATGTALARLTSRIVQGPDGNTYPTADCVTMLYSTTEFEGSCVCNGEVISEHEECILGNRRLDMVLACYWMASMGWGFVAFTNIMTATVARSVASWISTPEDVELAWRSCHHVIKSSLGTLCKGAAIDGGILALNEAPRHLPPLFDGLGSQPTIFPREGIVRSILSGTGQSPGLEGSFVRAIQPFWVGFQLPIFLVRLVTYYLQGYASVFVGMRRVSFSEAAGSTRALFRTAGMTLFINEVVVGVSLIVAGLAPVGLYAYQASGKQDFSTALIVFFAVWIHATLVVCLLPMVEVVMCAYRAVFVSFLQDPTALAILRDRQLQDSLSSAWRGMQLPNSASTDTNAGVAV